MITASEARTKLRQSAVDTTENELEQVETLINDAIASNKSSVSFDGTISSYTMNELGKRGYRVITGSQYNEPYVRVLWGSTEYEIVKKTLTEIISDIEDILLKYYDPFINIYIGVNDNNILLEDLKEYFTKNLITYNIIEEKVDGVFGCYDHYIIVTYYFKEKEHNFSIVYRTYDENE